MWTRIIVFVLLAELFACLATRYDYDYDYDVRLKVRNGGSGSREKTSVLELHSELSFALIWSRAEESLARIKLSESNVRLVRNGHEDTKLDNNALQGFKDLFPHQSEVYLHLKDCRPVGIVSDAEEAEFSTNLLRGVASIFNYKSEPWHGMEQDVEGQCSASYSADGDGVRKSKFKCQGCDRDEEHDAFGTRHSKHFEALYHFLKPSGDDELGFLCAKSQSGPDALHRVDVNQTLTYNINILNQVGTVVESNQQLVLRARSKFDVSSTFDNLKSVLEDLQSNFKKKFSAEHGLTEKSISPSIHEPINLESKFTSSELKAVVSQVRQHLKSSSLATTHSANAFKKLSWVFSSPDLDKDDFKQLMRDTKNRDILPQLMDVLGSCRSLAAHEAVLELYGNPLKTASPDLCERYLLALSQAKRSFPEVVTELLKIAKQPIRDPKLRSSLTLTLGSLARKAAGSKLSEAILRWFLESLSGCKDDEKSIVLLNGLRNAQNPSVAPFLIALVDGEREKKGVAAAAMKCLSSLPTSETFRQIGSKKLVAQLVRLFLDETRDSSVRGLAAEMLASHAAVDEATLSIVLKRLPDERKDFKKFLLRRILTLADSNPKLGQVLRKLGAKGILNWNLFACGGASDSFVRSVVGNFSFSFDLEMAGKMLKRSNVEFFHFATSPYDQQQRIKTSLLQWDMFGGGMSDYVDQEDGDEKDDREPFAGIQLTVTNAQLRPYLFFTSSAELMGLYWSGTAEEKTSAIQGNMMVQDEARKVMMFSGFSLDFVSSGAFSFDSSGQAQVSIWTKSATTTVENSGAYVSDFRCELLLPKSSLISHLESFEAVAKLLVQTDIDFGGASGQMCIRVSQPPSETRLARSQGGKKAEAEQRTRRRFRGRTLFLTPTISRLCNNMYNHADGPG